LVQKNSTTKFLLVQILVPLQKYWSGHYFKNSGIDTVSKISVQVPLRKGHANYDHQSPLFNSPSRQPPQLEVGEVLHGVLNGCEGALAEVLALVSPLPPE